ncbi:pyridoxal-phosphate dependent enzyme [Actinoplanes sp. NPDC023714]|uniref:pyridoxal-phosphate dependent enzyme n=1 Tax=Actinoplanes sp. NPDC023714 TaxID=3154322 RepID=UPI00340C3FB4
MRYDDITEAIGNTPLVRIDPDVHGLANIDLYAKMEFLNPFGSVKDRAAWSMVRPLLDDAAGRRDTVVELSSGNTAKALALIAGMYGLPFKSVTNRMKIPEIKDLLLLLGAEIEELPGRSECLDPADTDDPLTRMYRTLQSSGGYVHTDQYFNERNADAHFSGTGQEIVKDLDGRAPDYFIACVGTAGSSTGVARALRASGGDSTIVGLVAAKSDFIPGIRTIDEVHEVGLFDPSVYDTIETVTADEAIDGLLTLVRRCGTLAGPTGGGAYQGAVRYLRTLDGSLKSRKTAVFIVCDRVESYMSYLRERRPSLFGRPPRRNSIGTLTPEEIAAAPRVTGSDPFVRDALVVDLRSPFAYQALHIEGSINIGEDVFGEMIQAGLPFSRRQPVLLVCPVGEKSAAFAALLTRMGHPAARSLEGGIIGWRDAGSPLVRD